MIRFSAVLVAVAVGMLIGGIATSKLLLVYMAIAVSAVALVVLAIGVVLGREKLFGEGQGTAPAPADAGPASPAQAGDSDDRSGPRSHVPPPPLLGAAVGPGAAFAGYGQAGSPGAGAPRAEETASRGAWQSGTGNDGWSAPVTAASFPAVRPGAAPSGAPGDGWAPPPAGESPAPDDPVVPGGEPGTGSRGAWAPPSAFAPRAAVPSATAPGVAPGIGRSSWFSPLNPPAVGDAPSRPGTSWSWPAGDAGGDATARADGGQGGTGKPEEAAAADAGDAVGWPARYSWLSGEPADEEPAGGDPAGGDPADEDGEPEPDDTAVPPAVSAPAAGAGGDDPPPPAAAAPAAAEDEQADSVPAEPAGGPAETDGTGLAEPADGAEPVTPLLPPGPGATSDEAESAPPDGAGDLVTVIPGVPRFHQPDCVLIRFMADGDTQKMPAAQAEEAGCTPCAACHPEG